MRSLQTSTDRDTEVDEEQRALIERILASSLFEKSARLRDFLEYICDRSLSGHPEEVHEQFIGHHVFGRSFDYNPADDNIVRVAARQLRAKLREYFDTIGREERWLMQIPKGGYLPVFRERRPQAPTTGQARPAAGTNPRPSSHKWAIVLIIAAVVLLIFGVWGWKRAKVGMLRARQAPTASPIMHFFAGSKGSVRIVLSDSALVFMQTLAGHPFSLAQYADHSYRSFPKKLAHQPGMRRFWVLLSNRQQVSNLGDEEAAARFLLSMSAYRRNIVIRNARNMTARDFMSGNFILLGSAYSDPWTQLFSKDLNFQIDATSPAASAEIRNLNPSKGEKRAYSFGKTRQGQPVSYAHVALVPNLTDTGRVLLIAGLDMESTEAASDFLLNPSSTHKVQQIVGTDKNGRLPNFELLLQTAELGGTPKMARIVAFRVHHNRSANPGSVIHSY